MEMWDVKERGGRTSKGEEKKEEDKFLKAT